MPLPVIANTVRCALRGSQISGQPWINVLHFRKTAGVINAAALAALNTEVNKLYSGPTYGGGGLGLLNNATATTVGIDSTYTPLDGSSASTVLVFNPGGASAGDNLPGEVSECLSLRTAQRGRSFRGRLFLPCWAESSGTAAGRIGTGPIAACVAQASGFQTAIGLLSWEWVVASYKLHVATVINGWSMDDKYDVQRRRK